MPAVSKKKPVPVYLRGIPADLVREAKAQAARRGVTLASFVADTLARAMHESEDNTPAETSRPEEKRRELDAEAEWYEQHREQLVRKYAGQFVAIVDQRVVDHDKTFDALAGRIFKLRGSRDTFMPEVRAQKTVVRIRSPRVARQS